MKDARDKAPDARGAEFMRHMHNLLNEPAPDAPVEPLNPLQLSIEPNTPIPPVQPPAAVSQAREVALFDSVEETRNQLKPYLRIETCSTGQLPANWLAVDVILQAALTAAEQRSREAERLKLANERRYSREEFLLGVKDSAIDAREKALEDAAQHWPIGELGTLTDFRCSCGATLLSEPDSASRIIAWKQHIRATPSGAAQGGKLDANTR